MTPNSAPGNPSSRLLRGPWVFQIPLVFGCFLVVFLYLWLRIQPAGEYYSQGVVFFLNGGFFHRFLTYPGGLTDYGAAFLAQLNSSSWLGALVFTGLGALLFLVARRLCRGMTGCDGPLICLAPILVLLAWRGRYDGQVLTATLALLLALGAAGLCATLARRPPWVRWPAWWAVGCLLFYLAGLWPLWLCLCFLGWLGAIRGSTWPNVAGAFLPALLLPVAALGWPLPGKALTPWGTGAPLLWGGLAFLVCPLGFFLLAWFSRRSAVSQGRGPCPENRPLAPAAAGKPNPPAHRAVARPRLAKSPSARTSPVRWWRGAGSRQFLTLGGLLAVWALVWGLLDADRKTLAEIEYRAALKQYEPLLAAAARLKVLPPSVEIRAQWALYHTGRLSQDLFTVSSRGRGNLLPGLELGIEACLPQSQTLLELGQVNEAEHLAQEAIELLGDRPDALRLLADVNVLKDRPKAAAVFLRVCSEVPFRGAAAAARLAELERNPRLTGDPEMDLARSRLTTTDLPHDALPGEVMLRQSLDSNPKNQMAFEYLLAHYLLIGDFKRLARHAGQLQDFSYLAVPRHIEEALLLGQKLQGLEFELRGLKIRADTIQRFDRFRNAIDGMAGQGADALSALAPEFGDTFWLYYYSRLAHRPDASN